jgi:signal transduction histidine kinase
MSRSDTLAARCLDGNALPIARRAIDVRDLLRALEREVERLRPRAVNVEWQVEEPLPLLQTDAAKLEVVLRGLLSNALRFTARGSVQVSVRPRADGVEFSVADTGIGVPRSCLSRIFEPFTQLGDTSTRTDGGIGLGLYVARLLTELLGGTIAVSSRIGLGSSFQVWIPADVPTAICDTPAANLAG